MNRRNFIKGILGTIAGAVSLKNTIEPEKPLAETDLVEISKTEDFNGTYSISVWIIEWGEDDLCLNPPVIQMYDYH